MPNIRAALNTWSVHAGPQDTVYTMTGNRQDRQAQQADQRFYWELQLSVRIFLAMARLDSFSGHYQSMI